MERELEQVAAEPAIALPDARAAARRAPGQTGDDSYIERVTADGTVWSGGTVDAQLADDEWRFGRRSEPWTREAALPPDALETLRRAIADSGFFATAQEHRAQTPVIHASREIWTAELDGRRHTSTNHARGVVDVPELSALNAALEAALAATDR